MLVIPAWIVVFFILASFVVSFTATLGWLREEHMREKDQEERQKLLNIIGEQGKTIEKLNGKLTVRTADAFYNEGKKK